MEWGTPQPLFDQLNAEFHFELDVCASANNHKCERYYDLQADGLAQDWGAVVCWMNPPYGGGKTEVWIQKAYDASAHGATVVCLVPASTNSDWWHDYALPHAEIRYLRGWLKFVPTGGQRAGGSSWYPSALVIFRPR
jgi:site-specific DNA-methyltransferase (adenine-specific)